MRFARFARTLPVSSLVCLLPLGAVSLACAQDSSGFRGSLPTAANSPDGGAVDATVTEMREAVLPDAPGFRSSSTAAAVAADPADGQGSGTGKNDAQQGQPKRIFFIIPNYRSVSAGAKLPPQSPKSKFITASQDTFDYSALTLAVLVSVYKYGTNATPEFGSGGAAYGRYLWHSYADQAVENYSVEFIVPTLTHEDTRYYTLGHGTAGKRFVYAVTRAFVTRADDGHETFNAGEVIGAGVAAGLSNLYYPSRERTVGNTLDNYGTNVGIDAASFVLREFDQDIYRKFARRHATATP